MPDQICPFSATFAQKEHFSCPNADEVIRRGGSEYICLQSSSYNVCTDIHNKVKKSYLDSQSLEDDLLTIPHSTYVKIQFGCVVGLQSALTRDESSINDIGLLIVDAINHFQTFDALPYDELNTQISTYKLAKRGKKRR